MKTNSILNNIKNKISLWKEDENLEEKINSSPLYLLIISITVTVIVLKIAFLFA